jgi:hypothetical protein
MKAGKDPADGIRVQSGIRDGTRSTGQDMVERINRLNDLDCRPFKAVWGSIFFAGYLHDAQKEQSGKQH